MGNPKIEEELINHTTIVLMKGLPYSGKSHALSQYLAKQGNVFDVVVSPDCVRVAMHGERFLRRAEPLVWATTRIMARSLALWGHDRIFIDATGNTFRDRNEWNKGGDGWNVEVWEIKTPADICVVRAEEANDHEMVSIIMRMHLQTEGLKDSEVKFDPT